MPEFFYRASMNADILKSMDPRIREDDAPATQFMIHHIFLFCNGLINFIYHTLSAMIPDVADKLPAKTSGQIYDIMPGGQMYIASEMSPPPSCGFLGPP
jgi:hypothetical protein